MPLKRVEIRDLGTFRLVGGVEAHPRGRWAVYPLTRLDFEKNRYRTHLELLDLKTRTTRPLTQPDGPFRDFAPFVDPSGEWVYFLSSRDGEEKPPVLYRIAPDRGGEREKVYEPEGGVVDHAFSPDGKTLALLVARRSRKAGDKKPRPTVKEIHTLFHKLDTQGYLHDQEVSVVLLDLVTRKATLRFTSSYPGSLFSLTFSPDGDYLLLVGNLDGDAGMIEWVTHLYRLAVRGRRKPVKILPWNGNIEQAWWLEEGIVFAGSPRLPEAEFAAPTHLWFWDLSGEPEDLMADLDRSIGNALNSDVRAGAGRKVVLDRKRRQFYMVVQDGVRSSLYALDLEKRELRLLYSPRASIEGIALADRRLLLTQMDFTHPAEVYLYTPGKQRALQLTHHNDAVVQKFGFHEPEVFTFTASDGQEITGFVLFPKGRRPARIPAILEIHGGPRTTYGYGFLFEFHYLAHHGYAVMFTNPRGSAGFGMDYARAVTRHYGERDYQDLMEFVDAVLKRFKEIDPERLGVTGGSYGGFMTNWIVGHTDRFKAAVTQRSISNFLSFWGTSDIGWLFAKVEVGALPWDNLEEFWKRSPIAYAPKIQTPLLIIHSEEDYRCPVEQADQLFVALKVLGKTVRYVRFEGESHELSRSGKPLNREKRLQEIRGWFDRYLLGDEGRAKTRRRRRKRA